MTALAVARASLRRLVRDRTALFFLVVLPIVVIVIIGATVRGFSLWRVGVVDVGAGRSGQRIAAAMARAPDLSVTRFTSVKALSTAIARGELSAGAVVPAGLDRAERTGRPARVGLLVEPANSSSQAAAAALASIVSAEGARVGAAQFATRHGGGDFALNLGRATSLQRTIGQVQVRSLQAQPKSSILPGGFSYSAPTELVLFVFLSALATGATIVETRRLGMYERMRAAPVGAGSIVAGEALSALTVAVCQSVLIVLVGAVAFGVSWGDPVAAGLLLVLWSLVGAGAALLSGTVFKTPEQASAVGPVAGIALGMLGGCMWPLAIVSPLMRELGHATPHAWAVDAWTDLLSRGGTVATVLPDLGVLVAFAAALLVLATLRLHRVVA